MNNKLKDLNINKIMPEFKSLDVLKDIDFNKFIPEIKTLDVLKDINFNKVIPEIETLDALKDINISKITPEIKSIDIFKDMDISEITSNIKTDDGFKVINDIASKATCISNDLVLNYYRQFTDSIKIVNFLIENDGSKATLLYNLLFTIELSLKYLLLYNFDIGIKQVDSYEHNISLLINKCREIDLQNKKSNKNSYGDIDFDKLEELLNQFKSRKGKNLNINDYVNFRYNRMKNGKLIFNEELTKKDRIIVKEVIEWLNLLILI